MYVFQWMIQNYVVDIFNSATTSKIKLKKSTARNIRADLHKMKHSHTPEAKHSPFGI